MDLVRERLDLVDRTAKEDGRCRLLMQELKAAEEKLLFLERSMSYECRDAMWDYFGALENVNDRRLQLACGAPIETK